MIRISLVAAIPAICLLAVILSDTLTKTTYEGLTFVQSAGPAKINLIIDSGRAEPSQMHYLEHLVWLNSLGEDRAANIHSNAWTNGYAVGYWLSGQPDDLPDILSQLKGVFKPLELPLEFALQERDIVLREYEFRMAGNPTAQATVAMNAFLYDGNSIAASVIGTPSQIRAFTYDDAKILHDATHRPDNTKLVVTGDISNRDLQRALRTADWPDMNSNRADTNLAPFALADPATIVLRYPDRNAAARLLWRRVVTLPEPVTFDVLETQLALLRNILNTNLPGGIAGPLRFDATIARGFDLAIWPLNETTIEMQFSAAPDRGMSLTTLQQAFEDTLKTIVTNGIPTSTYDRVRDRFDSHWPDWADDDETAEWMARYVMDRLSALRTPLSERDLKRLNQSLSFETTTALLQVLADEGRTAIAFIGPEETFE